MNKTMKALAFAVTATAGGLANAAIVSETVFNLNGVVNSGAYAGAANTSPTASGNCVGCFFEGTLSSGTSTALKNQNNAIILGTVADSSSTSEHLHGHVVSGNGFIGYHSDSSGVYVRARDSSAFSLLSLDFDAPINAGNPDSGVNEYWEILGFSTALNPGLDAGDGTSYATRVAYQKVQNGFSGTVLLNSQFSNVSAFWIHYVGYPQVPADPDYNPDTEENGPLLPKAFSMDLDNIKLSTVGAVNPPTNVPVPGAVWLFATGLLSLLGPKRKHA